MGRFKQQVYRAYVLHSKDVQKKCDIVYLPLYMTPLVAG